MCYSVAGVLNEKTAHPQSRMGGVELTEIWLNPLCSQHFGAFPEKCIVGSSQALRHILYMLVVLFEFFVATDV